MFQGKKDSRDIHKDEMLDKAKKSLKTADNYFKLKKTDKGTDCLIDGLRYIGYALHPIQDKYSHTNSNSTCIGYHIYGHVLDYNADNAFKHKNAVLNAGKETSRILKSLYNSYASLRRKDIRI